MSSSFVPTGHDGLWASRNNLSLAEMIQRCHRDLLELAHSICRKDHHLVGSHSLLHEAVVRHLDPANQPVHLHPARWFALLSTEFRNIVISKARADKALKRGGGRTRLPLDERALDIPAIARTCDAEDLHTVLAQLQSHDPRQWEIVSLRIHGGQTMKQISDIMQHPIKTIEDEWKHAKRWLKVELQRLDEQDNTHGGQNHQ